MSVDTFDLVNSAMQDDALGVAHAFDAIIKNKIVDKLAERQAEIMQGALGGPEEVTDDDSGVIPDLE